MLGCEGPSERSGSQDLASLLFGRGLPAADELRSRLFDALGAEREWLVSGDDEDVVPWVVEWLSGPCSTSFIIRPSAPETPGLAVLEVTTILGLVHDVDAARAFVDDLNFYTTLNRWFVFGDPGPRGWAPVGGHLVEDDATRDFMASLVHAAPTSAPLVVCAASFVVGDTDVELPFGAVVLTVREQIAKATALMTNNAWELWGEPIFGQTSDGRSRISSAEWHDVVYHYDRRVTPYRDMNGAPLMEALIDAFDAHVTEQGDTGGPFWVGSGGEAGFTCEVPYGSGPFPDDAVWLSHPEREAGDDNTITSLVEAFIVSNPHIGNGLLATMRLLVPPPPEHGTVQWTAALLNEQARLQAPGATPGSAHGVGAWVDKDGQPTYCCFVPASWLLDPEGPDPRELFHRLLGNLARLSWSARRVLEFDPALVEAARMGRHVPSSGLAAGSAARGPAFGEPRTGLDPGARLLASAFQHTVGRDVEWARLAEDRRGFGFSPNSFHQNFSSERCTCVDEEGAHVVITTPLGAPQLGSLDRLAAVGASGHPFAVCMTPTGDIELRSKLHVHADTLGWLWSWPTTIAAAQAVAAEQLAVLVDRSATVDGWPVRLDRDEMLDVFELPTFRSPGPEVGGRRALTLAPFRNAQVPAAARWDAGAAVVVWSPDGSLPAIVTGSRDLVGTTLARQEARPYGPSIRVDTRFAVADVPHRSLWTLRANAALVDELPSTVVGGFALDEHLMFCSLVPGGLQYPARGDSDGAFTGTVFGHHRVAVVDALRLFPELRPEVKERYDSLEDGLASLVDFYRATFELPASLRVELEDTPTGQRALRVVRPRAESARSEPNTPALTDIEPDEFVTQLVFGTDDTLAALRILHSVLILGDHPQTEIFPSEYTLTARPLESGELWAVVGYLVDRGTLAINDQGVTCVNTAGIPGANVTITAADDGIGLLIECHIGASSLTDRHEDPDRRVRIGTWSHGSERSTYRVLVPGIAFATHDLWVRRAVLAMALEAVASKVSWVADLASVGGSHA
jgi:hypothetical protein